MARAEQPWLPKVKVPKVVLSKSPQPKLPKKIKAPRKFEILYHPFDLRFRGRISKWLGQALDVGDQRVEDRGRKTEERKPKTEDGNEKLFKILRDETAARAVELYFFPQGKKKRWLNQEEVLSETKIPHKKKLKKRLVESLLMLWEKARK